MTRRPPLQDTVAVIGVGSTGFSRATSGCSRTAHAVHAAIAAIRDAGLSQRDIDGVCGTAPLPARMVEALGLTDVTHDSQQAPPFGFTLIDAAHAILAGSCTTVLTYHSVARTPETSRGAAADPFRRYLTFDGGPPRLPLRTDPESLHGAMGYAAWAGRYLHETGRPRSDLGLVVINARARAAHNPLAAVREPLTMQEYANSPMIREPFRLADLDLAVDGADALVLTSAERARDLVDHPVLLHAAATGITSPVDEAQADGLHRNGQHVTAEALRARSDLWMGDVDLLYAYDGCSFLTLTWLENLGLCGLGEAGPLAESRAPSGEITLFGRVPLNRNGGGLGEGATQGSGQIRDAVQRLRGDTGARTAISVMGGLFYNAQGIVLRVE